MDTRIDYVYRNTSNAFVKLSSVEQLPADVAHTTTNEGKTVPSIVRLETGTLNRAIYQTAMLHNPVGEATPSPATRSGGWNKRLVYTFGGGCTGRWYRQGNTTGGAGTWISIATLMPKASGIWPMLTAASILVSGGGEILCCLATNFIALMKQAE